MSGLIQSSHVRMAFLFTNFLCTLVVSQGATVFTDTGGNSVTQLIKKKKKNLDGLTGCLAKNRFLYR